MHVIVDFRISPMGTGTASIKPFVMECVNAIKKSGLKFTVHDTGTSMEGDYETIMKVICECHEAAHKLGSSRVATDIRVASRSDKEEHLGKRRGGPVQQGDKTEEIVAKLEK
ncbi:hypothetical protein BJ742DRAFT_771831 [Cladochytrium replicatum]|nr:hypothetical protein BJ742DRAFT_771831 [Cladochytrium replicatum]